MENDCHTDGFRVSNCSLGRVHVHLGGSHIHYLNFQSTYREKQMMQFTKAKKSQAKLRLGIYGVAGGGKTFTALTLAKGLGGKVALIDTENSSASKYADLFDFDTLSLGSPYTPQRYIEAIRAAESAGYDVIVIDSTSHAWEGAGGAKDMASAAGDRMKNSFAGWKDVTPEYQKLTNAIIQSKAHVISTIRAKVEYTQDVNDAGKKVVKNLGLGLQAGKNQEYEYDILLEMTDGGKAIVQKSRYHAWSGQSFSKPGQEMGKELAAWLSDGTPAEEVATIERSLSLGAEYVRLYSALDTLVPGQLDVVAKEIGEAKKKKLLTDHEIELLRDRFGAQQARASK